MQLLIDGKAHIMHMYLPAVNEQPVIESSVVYTDPPLRDEVLLRRENLDNSSAELKEAAKYVEEYMQKSFDVAKPQSCSL